MHDVGAVPVYVSADRIEIMEAAFRADCLRLVEFIRLRAALVNVSDQEARRSPGNARGESVPLSFD